MGGQAAGRVLAFLTHKLMGHGVGSLYDVATILILWFAGASAITGMLNLVPRYLPRLGMAPRWVAYARPLVLVLFAVEVLVTLAFKAQVEAQGGAYATGVLVLMLSGAVAVSLALWQEWRARRTAGIPWATLYFWVGDAGLHLRRGRKRAGAPGRASSSRGCSCSSSCSLKRPLTLPAIHRAARREYDAGG